MKIAIISAIKSKTTRETMARGLIASFFGMFAMACSGCGGGGGGSPAPAVASTPRAILIEAYGDSTMKGYTYVNGVAQIAAQPAPAILEFGLQANYGDTITVANHGVNGSTAANLLNGDGVNLPWTQQMAQSQANLVYFNFGINDSRPESNESVAQYQQNLESLVKIAQAAGKMVILETPNPSGDPDTAALPSYVTAMRTVQAEFNLTLVDEYTYMLGLNWQSLMSDALLTHPTQYGYEVKGQYELPVFGPIIESMLQAAKL
jgi:acyl-CoA thioesterase-1